jgi:chitin disaccharide deacetylase
MRSNGYPRQAGGYLGGTLAKRLIVNADDLGYSIGVTDGILHAHKHGILTSATLMTTMPDCDRAIEISKSTPMLGVGIHLCLTEGISRSKLKGGGLLDAAGKFPRRVPKLALRLTSRKARQDAKDEWRAQIEYALQRGIKPTHLDSHKHIHHLPQLAPIVVELAQQFQIRFIRCANEAPLISAGGGAGYRVLSMLARRLKKRLVGTSVGTTDWFFGLATTGRTDSAIWREIMPKLPEGVGEVMVHPGDPVGLTAADTRLLAERTLEQNALCDPTVRQAVQDAGIELTHYGKL